MQSAICTEARSSMVSQYQTEASFSVMRSQYFEKNFSNYRHERINERFDVIQMNSDIQNQLEKILPPNELLLLVLGGCGGTGKSRVIHAIVDFAR